MARVSVETWRITYPGIIPEGYLARLSPEHQEESFARRLGSTARVHVSFVALNAFEEVIGFVNGGPERAGDPGYRGEIYELYLLREYQGQGIGRALVQQMARALAAHDIPSLLVWVLTARFLRIPGRPVPANGVPSFRQRVPAKRLLWVQGHHDPLWRAGKP